MKEKVVLAYSGGLDTTALISLGLRKHLTMKLSVAVLTVDRVTKLDGLDERAKLSGASKLYIEISLMISAITISCHAYRLVLYTNISIFLEHLWLVQQSLRN
mgnify:CR=1 FL=1